MLTTAASKNTWFVEAQGTPLRVNAYKLLGTLRSGRFAQAEADYRQTVIRMMAKRWSETMRGQGWQAMHDVLRNIAAAI